MFIFLNKKINLLWLFILYRNFMDREIYITLTTSRGINNNIYDIVELPKMNDHF